MNKNKQYNCYTVSKFIYISLKKYDILYIINYFKEKRMKKKNTIRKSTIKPFIIC